LQANQSKMLNQANQKMLKFNFCVRKQMHKCHDRHFSGLMPLP